MIKLQPGDYVSTEGMTEAQYYAVCKAFMDAGAAGEEVYDTGWPHVGWDKRDGDLYESRRDEEELTWEGRFTRKLTIDQILGSDNTEGAKAMTKVTVFGQDEQVKSKKKPIEFVKFLDPKEGPADPVEPSCYGNVVLLGKDSHLEYDLIMAWDDKYSWRNIYLGHWNDGVV